MRDIKFRAWHKNRKTFLDFDWAVDKLGRTFSILDKCLYDEFTDEIELMQFTGLHDKNGREIYEGDIVHAYDQEPDRYEPDYRGSEATGIVEFHGSMFMLDDDIILNYPPILEVIGNIYENPELSEEEINHD